MEKESEETLAYSLVLPASADTLADGKVLKKMKGTDLFEKLPHFFDNRLSDKQREGIVSSNQWQEYLEELPCSICGKKAGKCKCNPELLVGE